MGKRIKCRAKRDFIYEMKDIYKGRLVNIHEKDFVDFVRRGLIEPAEKIKTKEK